MAKELTPEIIVGKLFYYSDAAHKYHLDTRGFAMHKSLDKLYKGLIDFRDGISELLMGYTGKRIGKISIDPIPSFSNEEVTNMVTELKDFAYEIYEWAEQKKYCDIENNAQSLSGLAARTLYLLTLT